MDRENNNALERRLGLLPATLSGLGIIIGAGIYVLVGIAAGMAGNAVWISLILAAFGAGLTGLSYARLSRLRPKDAPEYQYISMAFNQRLGFLAGWLVLWAAVVSTSAVSLGFGGYLEQITGIPVLPSAIVLIILSSLVVFRGIGESAILTGILTVPEVIGLLFIVIIGIPYFGRNNLLGMPFGFQGVLNAASLVFFAFLGFESIANLSEEMKNPERDLPRAIFLSLGISTLLYGLVTISAVSILGWKDLSQTGAPLAKVALQVLGTNAGFFLSLVALAATASTVFVLLLVSSRAMWAMSCAGVLPMTFCVIGKERRTPWPTIIIVSFFACAFAFFKNIEEVAQFTNFATLLAFAGVNASAIKIFGLKSTSSRFKHVFGNLLLPGLGAAMSIWLAANTGLKAILFGLALLIIGVIVYWLTGIFQRKSGQT